MKCSTSLGVVRRGTSWLVRLEVAIGMCGGLAEFEVCGIGLRPGLELAMELQSAVKSQSLTLVILKLACLGEDGFTTTNNSTTKIATE